MSELGRREWRSIGQNRGPDECPPSQCRHNFVPSALGLSALERSRTWALIKTQCPGMTSMGRGLRCRLVRSADDAIRGPVDDADPARSHFIQERCIRIASELEPRRAVRKNRRMRLESVSTRMIEIKGTACRQLSLRPDLHQRLTGGPFRRGFNNSTGFSWIRAVADIPSMSGANTSTLHAAPETRFLMRQAVVSLIANPLSRAPVAE